MKTVIAIVMWTLSLFGVELGSRVRIDTIRTNGSDVLVSRVEARPTGTRFECVRSASGRCYYTVYPRPCTPADGHDAAPCGAQPVERFALSNGGRRQLALLAGARVCVRADATRARAGCD